jgi:hypothetical protein
MLACLMVAMWLAYFVIMAAIRHGQRELSRQQEVQDKLFGILQPLLAGGAPNRQVEPCSAKGAAAPHALRNTALPRVPQRCKPALRLSPRPATPCRLPAGTPPSAPSAAFGLA